jgi:hypothetical protein
MRIILATALAALLIASLTSGACCNSCGKCNSCAKCATSCGGGCDSCHKCQQSCCQPPAKPVCAVAELQDYNCPCVPICCICVRVDFCKCNGGPMQVIVRDKQGNDLGSHELSSCGEGCFSFDGEVMANSIDEVQFVPTGGSTATIMGVKIWSKLGCGDKVTLANFDLMNGVTVGGPDGCASYLVF